MKLDLSPKQRERLAVELDAHKAEHDRGLAIGKEWVGDEASLKEILAFDESSSVPTGLIWQHGGDSQAFREGFIDAVLGVRAALIGNHASSKGAANTEGKGACWCQGQAPFFFYAIPKREF